jgi:uncharacterized membrane protein HdeD (DUF308 family)
MQTSLEANWGTLAVRGVLALAFGAVALFAPNITLLTMTYLFGAYALGDGVCALVSGARAANNQQRWQSFLLEGIVGVGAGLMAFLAPSASIAGFMYLFGAYAIVTGVYEVFSAIRLRDEIEGEWLLGAAGLASILFGLVFILSPFRGGAVLVYMLGAYAAAFGAILLGLAWRLRGLAKSTLTPALS